MSAAPASAPLPAPDTAREALRRRRVDVWQVVPLLAAGLVALPIVAVPWLAFFPEENIWPHLYETVLGGYVRTTLALMAGVAAGTLVIGVGTAWLVTMCRFPGRRAFAWALLLPLAVPTYVIAYVYTDLLEYAGPVQETLRAAFGWSSAAEYRFPEIRSLGGAITMMSLVLYPYVYLMSRAAFLEQSVSLLDASRVLGCGPWATFFRVSLPVARPSIVVGLAFALMETLNDFGTVDFFAVRTLTAGVYDVWLNMGNLGGAAQISTLMLVMVAVLLTLERASRRRQGLFQSRDRARALEGHRLRGWRRSAAVLACAAPVAAGFGVPATVLGYYSVVHFESAWADRFPVYAANSLLLAASTAAIAAVLALVIAYGARVRPSRWLRAAAAVARLGYAVPGAVLAVGVVVPLAAFDNALDAFARQHLGVSTGLLLTGTVGALLFAYSARFLAAGLGAVESSLAKITPAMDDAARTLGHGPGSTFLRVHLPLIRGGVLTAALVVFMDTMKELPATLILRPFDFDTLATHVYQFASDELIEQASPGALAIVLAGLVPVVLLSRGIERSRPVRPAATETRRRAAARVEGRAPGEGGV